MEVIVCKRKSKMDLEAHPFLLLFAMQVGVDRMDVAQLSLVEVYQVLSTFLSLFQVGPMGVKDHIYLVLRG